MGKRHDREWLFTLARAMQRKAKEEVPLSDPLSEDKGKQSNHGLHNKPQIQNATAQELPAAGGRKITRDVLLALIPSGIALGYSISGLPPNIMLAVLCWAATAALVGHAIWRAFPKHRKRNRAAALFMLYGIAILFLWKPVQTRYRKEHEEVFTQKDSTSHFNVERHVELFYNGHDNLSPYLYSPYGPSGHVFPVYYLLYLKVQNLASKAATIESYSIDGWDGRRNMWVSLIHLSLGEGALYDTFPIKTPCGNRSGGILKFPRGVYRLDAHADYDPHRAHLVQPIDSLEEKLQRSLGANESIFGWEALDASDHDQPIMERMRIQLHISGEGVIIVDVPTEPSEGQKVADVHPGELLPTTVCSDLSMDRTRSGTQLMQ
jgi:hypothetical protein